MGGGREEPINLLRGWPAPALLPAAAIKEASTTVLTDPQIWADGLSYQPDEGYEPLRRELAAWLSDFYGPRFAEQPPPPIGVDRICISGGASQNLACVLQAFTDPIYTRNIWMVVPTYYLACRIFEDAGFHGRLRGVPEDVEGIDISYLRRGLKRAEQEAHRDGNTEPRLKPPHAWNRRYKHLIYCVPTFSNPSGRTMSVQRREELVRLAREFDALVVTDDVYDHLSWPHTAISAHEVKPFPRTAIAPRIVDIDRFLDGGAERSGAHGFGNALSQGSFSKLAGPGCRTGWAEGTPKAAHAVSQVGSSRSGGAPSGLVATFLAHMLQRGTFQAWIQEVLQPNLSARCQSLHVAIQEMLVPLGVQFWNEGMGIPAQDVEGGYFITIQLPETILATHLAERCQTEMNCIISPGNAFAVWGDENVEGVDLSRMVRLCFAWVDNGDQPGQKNSLREGVQRIAIVLKKMLENHKEGPAAIGNGHYHVNNENT